MNGEAFLSNRGGYTIFSYGKKVIRFKTSAKLERYTDIINWDNGYIEVVAKYRGVGEVEDYIDLVPILKNLYMDAETFLKPIKKVSLRYA